MCSWREIKPSMRLLYFEVKIQREKLVDVKREKYMRERNVEAIKLNGREQYLAL